MNISSNTTITITIIHKLVTTNALNFSNSVKKKDSIAPSGFTFSELVTALFFDSCLDVTVFSVLVGVVDVEGGSIGCPEGDSFGCKISSGNPNSILNTFVNYYEVNGCISTCCQFHLKTF